MLADLNTGTARCTYRMKALAFFSYSLAAVGVNRLSYCQHRTIGLPGGYSLSRLDCATSGMLNLLHKY
jgi:hypothetical protein